MSHHSQFGLRKLVTLVVLLIVSSSFAVAQVSTASISGIVQDNTGAVVPGAAVIVTQTATNAVSRAMADAGGGFSLPALPIGPYSMRVTAAGFARYDRTNIVLTVGQVANFNIQLKVGGASESVTVTSGAPLVEATDATIENTVDEQTVGGLPLNGRDPSTLVFDVAGAVNTGENTGSGQLAATNQITPPQTTVPGSIAPAVNGVRAGGTFFSLDGATNIDPQAVVGGPFPDPDATQEFEVVTGTYGARYFSAPGGAVNIVTKSGSNQLHGALFEYIRNGFFNGENAIFKQPDTLKRNQFGGTLGGSVIKDKLFYFGSYQGTKIASQVVNSYPVPTAAERTGTFPCTATGFNPFCQGGVASLSNLPDLSGPHSPFGPNTESPVNANFYNYQNSGNSLIPAANSGSNFVVGVPNHLTDNQYVGRIDDQLNQKNLLFARYYTDHSTTPAVAEPTAAPYDIFDTAAGFQYFWDDAAIGDTWTTNSQWVLETRVSFLNIVNNQLAATADSFTNYPAFGSVNFSNPNPPGAGITVVGNMIPPSVYPADKYPRTNFVLTEDAIHVKGKHEITFGGDLDRIHFGENNVSGQTGVIIYPGVYSNILAGALGFQFGDAEYADFYLGHPVEFIQGDGFFISAHGWLTGFYGQDKYRVTNRLTATFGARWDPFVPYTIEHNHISCFRAGEQSTVYANAPLGLVYAGDKTCPTGGVNGDYKVVQPRIGLAYQLNKTGTDVIHAGYGVYTIQVPLSSLGGFTAFPFTRQYIIANPFQSISDPWGSNGLTNPFASGFIGFGYNPPSNVAFPTSPAPIVANLASNFRPGYVQQYSLSYQKGIGSNDSVELAYVGSKGTHMAQNYDLNQPIGATSTAGEQAARPYQGMSAVSTEAPIGWSNYSGFQATYRHRAGLGLNISSNFTWSKCIDDGSNPGGTGASVQGNIDLDPLDPAFSNGLCDFDQPFNWRNTAVWTSPALDKNSALVRAALGSWIVSGNVILDSGQPFSIQTGTADNSFTGEEFDRADYVAGQPLHQGGRLNYAAFTLNAAGTLGDSPRNGFRSAADDEVDTALMKNFKLTEKLGLMFRAEAFNIINHPNYFAPLSAWNSANAGDFDTYQAARDPRQLQFALKLMF